MVLEHGKNPVKYRWCDNEDKAVSEWFHEIREALQWIIKHDEEKMKETKSKSGVLLPQLL
jgi:hypothetical protein